MVIKIITLDLTRIVRMQQSWENKKLSAICSKSSSKYNLKTMFKHQYCHMFIMNTGHEINLTAILVLLPLALTVTSINVRSDC